MKSSSAQHPCRVPLCVEEIRQTNVSFEDLRPYTGAGGKMYGNLSEKEEEGICQLLEAYRPAHLRDIEAHGVHSI
jgi:hypothetical protein